MELSTFTPSGTLYSEQNPLMGSAAPLNDHLNHTGEFTIDQLGPKGTSTPEPPSLVEAPSSSQSGELAEAVLDNLPSQQATAQSTAVDYTDPETKATDDDSLTGVDAGAALASGNVKVNFQPDSAPVPDGYIKDTGQAYDNDRGYGWVSQDSLSQENPEPLDITLNTRDRDEPGVEQQLDTLIHMQYPDNSNSTAVQTPAAWEHALPDGTYKVTVSVGDPSDYDDSQHTINVEGVKAIEGFQESEKQENKQATVEVKVTDGKLTVDAIGGSNTKLNYVEIEEAEGGTSQPEEPEPSAEGGTLLPEEPEPSEEPKPESGPHPGMYLDAGEIAAIKQKVQAGEEPWDSAYDKMIADANKALKAGSFSITENGGPNGGHDYRTDKPYYWKGKRKDGQINPNADRKDYAEAMGIGKAVRDLGLGYAFTNDSKYAEKAIDLIETWSVNPKTRMNPKFTDNQSRIELAITIPGMFYGADLIDNYPGWSAKEKNGFEAWVGSMAKSAQGWQANNNYDIWRTNFIASAGSLLENKSLLNHAFDRYKKAIIPTQIDNQGRIKPELGRTKSLSYSLFGVNAMVQVAEIAEHHGVNLYDYTSGGKGLERALDYHAQYAVNPGKWPYKQIAPLEEDSVGIYELAYSQWQKPSYLKVINHWGRPLTVPRILGPVSLTHAN